MSASDAFDAAAVARMLAAFAWSLRPRVCPPAAGRHGAAPPVRAAGAREAVMTVTATPLERVELTRTISMNGSVFAWQDVIIASEVGGYRVADVFVDVGDRVKKGQRLVALSTALLEAEVATKQATLNQRRGRARRTRKPRSSAARSLADDERAVASRSRSAHVPSSSRRDRGVESARADLDTSQLRLKFTNVTAPDDGVITSRTVTVGQIAQAGGEMLRLLRNGRIEWRGEVPETRLDELAPGQRVTRHHGRRHAVPRQDSRRLADDRERQSHGPRLRRPAAGRAAAPRHVRARRDRDRPRPGASRCRSRAS